MYYICSAVTEENSSEYLGLLQLLLQVLDLTQQIISLQLNETKTKSTPWQSFTSYFKGRTRSKFSQKTCFLKICSEIKPFRSTLSAKATQHSANKGLSPERSLHNSEPPPHCQKKKPHPGRSADVSTHSHTTSACTPSNFSLRNIQQRARNSKCNNCISTQMSYIAYTATPRS